MEASGPSLAKRKMKDKFPLIIVPEYFWVPGEVSSSFNIYSDSMVEFISA